MHVRETLKDFFWKRKKEYDWKDEIKDWITSFIVVAVIYFLILPAILGASSPMVVVSSCSEKGFLNIGDVIIVKGTSIKDIKAPEVQANSLEFTPVFDGKKFIGVNISGKIITPNSSNDIVVYYAFPSRTQIIHRALAKIKVKDKYFLITKGDANPIPDQIMVYNNTAYSCITENYGCISTPVTQKMLVGKKIGPRIPIVGHVKLFFCDIMPFCYGHSNPGTGFKYKLSC